MVLWGILFGAIFGWCVADFEGFGFVAGGIVGLAAGFGLRAAVRGEIERAHRDLLRALPEAARAPDKPRHEPETATIAPPPRRQAETSIPITAAPRAAPPRSAPAPVPSAEPNIIDHAIAAARGWLLGGNSIVRMGLVILFVGLSFLARYAANAGIFPVELRLTLVAGFGIALLVIGFRKRSAAPGFALALQGAGVAVLYLTAFAAGILFDLIPVMLAFAIMILICALGCALALLQNAQGLAAASFTGGFAVPVLLAGSGAAAIIAFSYYTMLNLAVLVIAQKRSWRIINLVGFFATFGMAGIWGAASYQPADYPVAQLFLIISVLIYVAAAILYARNTPGKLGNVVDSTLLFGPALAGFGLQAGLVRAFEFGAAFSALGFAALYIALATFTIRLGRENYRLLGETMIAIGVGFVTLAIPLALGVRWTASAWALEGAGAFWVGMRQARWTPRLFGLALQPAAALAFLASIDSGIAALPFANPLFVGAMLIALPAIAIAWWQRHPLAHGGSPWAIAYARIERRLGDPAFLFGFLFWCLAIILEIFRRHPAIETGAPALPVFGMATAQLIVMLALIASAALWAMIGRQGDWPVATWPGRATLAVLAATLLGQAVIGSHALHSPGWIVWPIAIALHYRLLYRNDTAPAPPAGNPLPLVYRATHVGGVWLITALLADCLWFLIDRGRLWSTSWAGVVFLVSAIAILLALTLWAGRRAPRGWPLIPHATGYSWQAALPLAILVFAGALMTALFASGAVAPLPYVPLLNPIDLALALALAALVLWRRTIVAIDPAPAGSAWLRDRRAWIALAGLAFVIVNTVWLRIAHHIGGIAWKPAALLDSFIVQTGLAILWTLLALALMLVARARAQRAVWITGAGLLGLVVAKLAFVDLSNAGGGERIVTFIVVGVLMLVVGYFAPLPPRAAGTAEPAPATEAQA